MQESRKQNALLFTE